VKAPRPRRDRRGEDIGIEESALGLPQRRGIEAERVDSQLAAVIGAVRGQQPGLVRDEGEGVRGAHRAAHDRAGVRVDAARHVEGEHGDAKRVELADDGAMLPLERPLEADAEQAVDGEVEARPVRDRLEQRPARALPFGERALRVLGQLLALADEHQADAEEAALQQRSRLEGVAAVVSRPGDDEDRLRGVAAQAAREFGGGASGALHQGHAGGARFELADRARAVDRLHGHRRQ
jgi:hypothetical protein